MGFMIVAGVSRSANGDGEDDGNTKTVLRFALCESPENVFWYFYLLISAPRPQQSSAKTSNSCRKRIYKDLNTIHFKRVNSLRLSLVDIYRFTAR